MMAKKKCYFRGLFKVQTCIYKMGANGEINQYQYSYWQNDCSKKWGFAATTVAAELGQDGWW